MSDDYREALEVERHQEAKHDRRDDMEQTRPPRRSTPPSPKPKASSPPSAAKRPSPSETRTGASYTFSYAELGTIIDACRPALVKHGLAISQQLEHNGTGPALRTELRHKDGGIIATSFPLTRVPESPQQLGSLLTYLRRYAITALFGIATEDDDDAGQVTEQPSSQFQAPHRRQGHHRTATQKDLRAEKQTRPRPGTSPTEASTKASRNATAPCTINELNREDARDLIDRLEALEARTSTRTDMKEPRPKRRMAPGLDLPMRQPAAGDLRRVRLLRTRTPLQPLPKENRLNLTVSDIALAITVAVVAVICPVRHRRHLEAPP